MLERCCHTDSLLTSYGDQGIVVRKDYFAQHQLMPSLPLFEDVAFFQNVRRRTTLARVHSTLHTSTRRFERLGFFRTHLINTALIFCYLIGVSPKRLHAWYHRNLTKPV